MGAAAARPGRAAPMFERRMKDGEAGMNVAGLPWAPPPPALAARLAAMPKVELHVHLEGAMTPETIWQLVAENGVDLPAATLDDWRRQYAFTDFNHFIETYQLATRVMRRAEDFAFMVERFGAMQTAQNVRYSEVFISTSLHLDKITPEALAEALAERGNPAVAVAYHGFERPRDYGIRARPLVGCEPVEGWVAISQNLRKGLYAPGDPFATPDRGCFAWLEAREPIAVPGDSIWLYEPR